MSISADAQRRSRSSHLRPGKVYFIRKIKTGASKKILKKKMKDSMKREL
jgi:hypothetical protein